ncbi:MAG: ABC transporter substrate-binding protein [Chloroflexota bacterium]|nr:ABC transporter substrate-binding protein [Chloroflexota bacterium]
MSDGARRFVLVLAVLVTLPALLLASAACSPGSSGEVTYTVTDPTGDWGYPSPYAHYSRGPGYIRMSLIFDTLVWKDEDGFIPALAESWQYIDADTAYLFQLREGVTWHDGEAFDADDVAFTIEYVKAHPLPFVTLIGPTGVSEVEVIDDYSIKLYLEQPYAPFLTDVAGTMVILPRHVWESVDDPATFTEPQAVIGTGPFTLADYSKEHGTYLYKAYEDYYQGEPAVASIIFDKVSEEMAPTALQQGSASAADIPAELVDTLQADGFTILRSSYSWNAKLLINHTREPFSSREFRQALAYAIDREELVDITQRGYGIAGSPGLLPPDNQWYNPDIEMYEYDPATAQQLLASLGYELENGYLSKDGTPLEVVILSQTAYGFKEVGQFVQQELEDLGLKVNLVTLEGATLDARVDAWDFDLAIYGHGGLYEPSILPRVITADGFNSARYTENETLNQLLEDQAHEMDPEQRLQIVQEIQAVYAEEVPALTLYYPDWYWARDGTVELFYTEGGVASGIPIPLNKVAFLAPDGS